MSGIPGYTTSRNPGVSLDIRHFHEQRSRSPLFKHKLLCRVESVKNRELTACAAGYYLSDFLDAVLVQEILQMPDPVTDTDNAERVDVRAGFKMFQRVNHNRLIINLEKLFRYVLRVHSGPDTAGKYHANIHKNLLPFKSPQRRCAVRCIRSCDSISRRLCVRISDPVSNLLVTPLVKRCLHRLNAVNS